MSGANSSASFGIERVGGRAVRAIERDARQRVGALDLLAALRRDQELKALTRTVDAHRQIDFARDRHRLLEQERRCRIAQRSADARARRRELCKIRKPAHQSALAAPAFQHLRLEHVPRPLRRFVGRGITRAQQHTARDRKPVPAQQGFPVDLGQAHNASPPPRAAPAPRFGY